MEKLRSLLAKPQVVWIARLLLGATFMLSGVTKMVDPWGTLTKIEAYLSAWNLADTFGSGLALIGGCALSVAEFITGFLLLTGSLRRSAAAAATLLMLFMLPLTAYIALANPVEDCGCFGDFLVISNSATFWKNVVLTLLAVYLLFYNRRARCIFAPWVQWLQVAVAVAYMLSIGVIGYHVQPLLDFRAYPVGEPLVDDEGGDLTYIYADAAGTEHEFDAENLPDESEGWTFVDVRQNSSASGKMLELFDRESGEEVTDRVIGATPGQILLLIPRPSAATAAGSYTANELNGAMTKRFGPGAFVAVTEGDSLTLERTLDLMMADYPVYLADSKAIKAVARGDMAAVYVENDTVRWKRTLSSINLDLLTDGADPAKLYVTDGGHVFRVLTLTTIIAEVVVAWLGSLTWLYRRLRRFRAAGTRRAESK